MASKAGEVKIDNAFFSELGKSPGVVGIVQEAADRVMQTAITTAPVDSGDYKSRFVTTRRESQFRTVVEVTNIDPGALAIEARTGNMARAVKRSAKR